MSGGVYIAGAGALLQQLRLEKLADNLSNVSTAGFKKEIPVFSMGLFSGEEVNPTNGNGEGGRQMISPYAPPYYSVTDFSEGVLSSTQNPFDMAIDGEGFFVLQTDEGVRYTRSGNFTRNEEGVLTNLEGLPVLGEAGEIQVDGEEVFIDGEGNISVDGEILDRLRIVSFDSLKDLMKVGHTLFKLSPDSETVEIPSDNFTILQGFLELSNVEVVQSMTDMIETSRAFEAYQKVIRTLDEIAARVVNDVGKVS